jgi:hypothetical protein
MKSGAAGALRLWPVVIAVWMVPLAVMLPLTAVVEAVRGGLPAAGAELAPGDAWLLMVACAERLAPALLAGAVATVLVLWGWTVLWHAGVVGWWVWASGRPVRIGEVVGHGVSSWWRYCRLSLFALSAGAIALVVVWAPLVDVISSAYSEMAEERVVRWIVVGLVATFGLVSAVWAATSAGAWHLGCGRRSAALAWAAGLVTVMRHPVASAGAMTWAVAGAAFTVLPWVLAGVAPALRAWPLGTVATQLSALAAAFCWVALFQSFATVCDDVVRRSSDAADPPRRSLPDSPRHRA